VGLICGCSVSLLSHIDCIGKAYATNVILHTEQYSRKDAVGRAPGATFEVLMINHDAELSKILDLMREAKRRAHELDADMLEYLIGAAIDEAGDIVKGIVKLPRSPLPDNPPR
jgi:hypothetical protein